MSATRPTGEAREDTRLDAVQLLRRPVGGDGDARARVDQVVERVEEFLLRRPLAGDELDIVDQQQIERRAAAP